MDKEKMKYIKKKLNPSEFKKICDLSQGKFSSIYLVEKTTTRKLLVAKVFNKNDMIVRNCKHRISWELKILSNLDSPYFPSFIGTSQTSRTFTIYMEYFPGGDFYYWEKRIGDTSPKTSQFYMSQLVIILDQLHSQNIVYRDLKPENIILHIDGYLRLVDFGSAIALPSFTSKTYSITGTPEFSAPEIILNHGHSIAADFWSLGVMIYEFISKENPFYEKDPMISYSRIAKGQIFFPKGFPSQAKDIVRKLMVVTPKKRLGVLSNGIDGVKEHAFFKGTDWDDMANKNVKAPLRPKLDSLRDTRYFSKYKIPKHELIEVKPSEDPFIIW